MGQIQDQLVLCTPIGLPRIASTLWQSLAAARYSESYVRRYLLSIESFYNHCEQSGFDDLDFLFINGEINKIYISLRSFLAKLQNENSITGIDQSERWQMVIKFTNETLEELLYRSPSLQFRTDLYQTKANLRRIESLYGFLRPPKNARVKKPRAIPSPVLADLYEVIAPQNSRNPFRNDTIKWRNFLIISLLLYQGLRAGELLSLTTGCVKHSFDPQSDKDIFWINVQSTTMHDLRAMKPKIKNANSVRQVPIDKSLAHHILHFEQTYRKKCPHGFLLSSNRQRPLSISMLESIISTVSSNLSQHSKNTMSDVSAYGTDFGLC